MAKDFLKYVKLKLNYIIYLNKEKKLIIFFGFLFLIILIKLFSIQVIGYKDYYSKLFSQHFSESSIKSKRGNILLKDSAGKDIYLTQNIELFTLYVDPKYVLDKKKLIEVITPTIYSHLCEIYGISKPDKQECFENMQRFLDEDLFDEKSSNFFLSGNSSNLIVDVDKMEQSKKEFIDNFSTGMIFQKISEKLDKIIVGGFKQKNYFGFYENEGLLNDLRNENFPFLEVNKNYIYIIPTKVSNLSDDSKKFNSILSKNGFYFSNQDIVEFFKQKEIRYVKIVDKMSSILAQQIKQLKIQYYYEKIDRIPLLHGIGLQNDTKRFYPYGKLLSHILGFVDENGKAYYGIEGFFYNELQGIDGKIQGLSVPWIGTIGTNNFEIEQSINGNDIYLTIDLLLQKRLENLLKNYFYQFHSDNISAIIMDPYTGKIKAMANYPDFDPNFYFDNYKIRKLTYADSYIVDDDSYIDIPVLIYSGENLQVATYEERKDPKLEKYIFKNIYGPTIFIDKNISFPYEPGSIFKSFTLGIGEDLDVISVYDMYDDRGSVSVGPYTMSNVHKECKGFNTYLHALERSCNVGMINVVQKIQKYGFYNYLDKIGFGKKTGIELMGEEKGEIMALTNFSKARFFNNSFGQGILATPIQILVGYAALVNGGELVKPTIIDKIYNPQTDKYIEFNKKIKNKIFKKETSEVIKTSLFKVVDEGDLKSLKIDGYTLGGKTGTSQIAFKGKYHGGNGWTNSSFVGIITKDNLKYVIIIQVRRPRSCQWGTCTAGVIYKDLARFLIENQGITK